MIQKESMLEVADNSGARKLKVIGLEGSTRKRYAYVGDRVKCAVKKAIPEGMVKKGDVVDVVIVRTVKATARPDGSYISFADNAGVILKKVTDKQDRTEPLATRISGPVARELRSRGFHKIISLAPEVL
jgi:large subunit ribosomal protein L14